MMKPKKRLWTRRMRVMPDNLVAHLELRGNSVNVILADGRTAAITESQWNDLWIRACQMAMGADGLQ